MVFLCHFRPDKIHCALRRFVCATLGHDFLDEEESMDVGRAYAESVAATPLIFVLGQRVDPLKYIFRFAEETGFSGSKLKMVTLGSGQEDRARELIRDFYQTSTWVVLVNCHLVPDWSDELEYLVDDLGSESTHPDFRLWITTRPHPGFSVPTLQAGVKVALEEPGALKAGLVRHLAPPDKAFAAAFNARSVAYRRMCFGIALFHAAINERGNYSQCGWNQSYTFGESDYDLALSQMGAMLRLVEAEDPDDPDACAVVVTSCLKKSFSPSTLHYLLSSCVYGGCMEDEMDAAALASFLHLFCPAQLATAPAHDTVSLDPEGVYHTARLEDHETMMGYLAELPKEASHKLSRMSEAVHR